MTSSELFNKFKLKLFNISELFNIKNGTRINKNNHIAGNIKFISSTEYNNGITNSINYYNNVITISYDGSIGNSFYHNYNMISSDSCKVLNLKNKELSKYIEIFLITSLERLRIKYKYGLKLNSIRLKKEQIWLPIKDETINWNAMEEYIKLFI